MDFPVMSAEEWQGMVAAFTTYYGPMLATWRILLLTCAVVLGIIIFMFLVIQRGLSAYL